MKIEKNLKKQIVIEIIALLFLIVVLIYAFIAINKSNFSKIKSEDGIVTILDDTYKDKISMLSDGAGIMQNGITYTITNNNKYDINYNIIIVPSTKNNKVLDKIRIGIDDLYIENLTDLDRTDDGFIIATNNLKANYTKKYLIKLWYKLDTNEDFFDKDIKFNYKIVRK